MRVETVHNNTQRWHPLLTALVEFEVVLRLFFILRNGTERVAETLALFLVLLKDTVSVKNDVKRKKCQDVFVTSKSCRP